MSLKSPNVYIIKSLLIIGLIHVNFTVFFGQNEQTLLDQKLQVAIEALQSKNWKLAQTNFEEAIKIYDKEPAISQFIFSKLRLSESKSEVYVNGVLTDTTAGVQLYRLSMGTKQALYTFAAYSSQLSGDNQKAEYYLKKVEEMPSLIWGKTWSELVPKLHDFFFSYLTEENSENFSKYLFISGRLLLQVNDPNGLKLIRESKQILRDDPAIPALLASYLITHNDPLNAKIEAQDSLKLNPKQVSVLIDLAMSEWMLGELDAASKDALQAQKLDPTRPGPHSILAFVALERGDLATALKEAELGNRLSDGHQFYKTILAVCLEASGNSKKAMKLMKEAWKDGSPDEEQLKAWFFRGKVLEYVRRFIKPRELLKQ